MTEAPTHEVTLVFNTEEFAGSVTFQAHIQVQDKNPAYEGDVIQDMLESTFPDATCVYHYELE